MKITFFIIIFFILTSFIWNKYFNKILIDLGKMREKHAKKLSAKFKIALVILEKQSYLD